MSTAGSTMTDPGESKDFGAFMAGWNARVVEGVAPARRDPVPPNIERLDDLRMIDDESYDASRPQAWEDCNVGEIDDDGIRWAADAGLRFARNGAEGAAFARIAEDAFLIPVVGAQPLHHDRHVADVPGDGFSEHTWNLVVLGSETQLLLCENADGVYEHFSMTEGVLVYMNTVNRHMLSRKDPQDVCVILQVTGYGPEERDLAMARMAEIVEARPAAVRL